MKDCEVKRQVGKSDRGRTHTIYQTNFILGIWKDFRLPCFSFSSSLAMACSILPTRLNLQAPSVKAQNYNH